MKFHRLLRLVPALTAALLFAAATHAEPWIAPGDAGLRHDVQLLADTGVLHTPTLSWPLPWSNIARDIERVDVATLGPAARSSAARLHERALAEMRIDEIALGFELAAASEPEVLRTFSDTPREDGEAALLASRTGQRFAWKAVARVVADVEDGQTFRPDGSYVAASLGNWMLSAGYLERWWGPGWQGSLILSNSARPVPGVSLDRNESTPFEVPVLRWLGPWRFSTFMGQLEGDRDYPQTLLFGMRAEIRPIPSLQIAASRTAQWCGDGRPCGLDTFVDLLAGNDNDQPLDEQPGNQLAGFDLRWSWPGGRVPLALYAQGIGEDEAGFLPSKYLGLVGLETWGVWGEHSWRGTVEYADTACDFINSQPDFGCAYENSIYTTGYRFRGRAIGHSMDGDGEMISSSLMLLGSSGHRWQLTAREVKLNRAGQSAGHTLSPSAAAKLQDVVATHDRAYPWGNITALIGYAEASGTPADALQDGFRGSLSWRRAIH